MKCVHGYFEGDCATKGCPNSPERSESSLNDGLTVGTLSIPEKHAEFANKVAALADEYGMDQFTMTYRPDFDSRFSQDYIRDLRGEMKIHYSSVDGRGRPCRNLRILCEAAFSLQIESNPESCS